MAGAALSGGRGGRAVGADDEPATRQSAQPGDGVQCRAASCLRKDFIFDEYEIVEARAHRADAILLIAAALDGSELKRLAQAARSLTLDVLVEVYTAEELDGVLDALGETGADAIGVNNRDLKTFEARGDFNRARRGDSGERGARD